MIEANPLHQRWEGVPELLKLLFASLLIVPIAFGQNSLTTAQIAKRVSPSVVVIQGKTDSGEVLGSGFIVSKDGNIVTNLHVIRDMKTASVQLANGRTLDSVFVLATDERRDLAIIHISGFDPQKHDGDILDQILDQIPQRSQVLDLGNSDSVSVGEPVVVVGSPQGLEGTVTAGILSSVRDSGEGFKVLQTDAAVNPGNSGGPLVNNRGQAIGVVSFKLRSAEGLNFAIPINYVRELLNNLHNPLTLEQMRRSLNTKATPDTQSSGKPSLKETL
jgi:serine protease Do